MYLKEEVINVKDNELLLRNANEDDAELLIKYLKITSGETKYLVREPEEIALTIEQERQFIIDQNESENCLMLLGFMNGEHVGNCSLMGMSQARYRHRASLGIALYQKYNGIGIGRCMLGKLMEIAPKMGLEQIELEVMTDNVRAISLYKKIGFEVFGTFLHNMKYKDGTYADAFWMMKRI